MGDLLVPLYRLEDLPSPEIDSSIRIQRPLSADRHVVVSWVKEHFSERWASETAIAFSSQPVRCFVALDRDKRLLGFACHDVSWKGFFGPTGVTPDSRGLGIGTILLRRSLEAMKEAGYAYAIIGGSGVDTYYEKTVGAIPIPDSAPGPYRDWIEPDA